MRKYPINTGRISLVIELELPRNLDERWLRLLVSIPGREGTLTRVWQHEGPQPSSSTVADIVDTIALSLIGAITVTHGGVQNALELGDEGVLDSPARGAAQGASEARP